MVQNEYLLQIKVKNNLLFNLMRKNGLRTQAEAARAIGLTNTQFGEIANLKIGAYKKDGTKTLYTTKLCEYFCCSPEEIFPKEILFIGLPKNTVELAISYEKIRQSIDSQNLNPALILEKQVDTKYLLSAMNKMTPRMQKVIKMRYFENMTLEEVAHNFDVTRERIRQIEQKSLRCLRYSINLYGNELDDFDTSTEGLATRFADCEQMLHKMK